MKESKSNSEEKNCKINCNNSPTNSFKSNNSENFLSNKNQFSLNNLINDRPTFVAKTSYHNPVTIEEARIEENSINKKDNQNNYLNRSKFNRSDVNSAKFIKQSQNSTYLNRMTKDDDKSYRQSYDNYNIDTLHPVALRNLGNTCYMNVIVQTLFNLPTLTAEIRDSMDKAILKKPDLPFTMTRSIMELFDEYRKLRQSPTINDEELEARLCIVKNNVSLNHVEFKSSGQHDAVEFLDAIINSVDDEYNKVKKLVSDCVNPIDKVFKIIYGEQSICENCNTISKTIETAQHCLFLSLPEEKFIKQDLDLQDLLNNYFKTEKRESKCENCNFKERKIRMKVIKSPRVLILQLGRYTSANDKRHEQINVPQIISLPKVVRKERIATKINPNTELNTKTSTSDNPTINETESFLNLVENKFVLNGVICHYGSCAVGGHYISYVFDPLSDQWYQCDDDIIKGIEFADVQAQTKSSGYCFFYLKQDKKTL